MLLMPETVVREPGRSWRPRRPALPESRGPFAPAAASAFCAFAVAGLFASLGPSLVQGLSGTKNVAVGGGATFVNLAATVAAQAALRSVSNRTAVRTGLPALAVGLGLLLWSMAQGSVALVLLAAAVVGFGTGLSFMGSLAAVNAISEARERGVVASSYFVVAYLAPPVAALSTGVLADRLGLFPAVTIFALVTSSVALLLAGAASRIGLEAA
ncbi:MAG: hypothetical protein AVDCRST_MAG03-3569 [uncultured Rubrobacteraceae bacterium]|uniref:Major facilitator superfamily (MFS) profile domain-containing protein n=1 Tax=uncultured Rubrobacteraceae bacterium TaxID=349277 RepID=A0A6J4Q825_9ACTN|nr:MAG: hypothetical protein AVDCRST_MAG03-3569 [uncultured Rubrobacteraceae bacterium]